MHPIRSLITRSGDPGNIQGHTSYSLPLLLLLALLVTHDTRSASLPLHLLQWFPLPNTLRIQEQEESHWGIKSPLNPPTQHVAGISNCNGNPDSLALNVCGRWLTWIPSGQKQKLIWDPIKVGLLSPVPVQEPSGRFNCLCDTLPLKNSLQLTPSETPPGPPTWIRGCQGRAGGVPLNLHFIMKLLRLLGSSSFPLSSPARVSSPRVAPHKGRAHTGLVEGVLLP